MAQSEASKKEHENTLTKIAGMIGASLLKVNPLLVKSIIENIKANVPMTPAPAWDGWADNLVKNKHVDQDTADLLKGLKDLNWPLNWLAFTLLPLIISKKTIEASMDIFQLDAQYAAQSSTTPHPAPVDNLVRSMIMDPARSNENREQLKRLGYDKTQQDNIILSYYRTTEEGVIRTNFLRGNITEALMYERMRELGYTDTRTAEIIQTWIVYPGPGDLFEMVAKEAFEPDIYKVLGLDQEFPSEQVKWLEAQGISQEWAEKYWIAHWNQPSIGQGFEMLHRGVITPAQLDLLFRAVEIPSFWRSKLTAIAYSPFTRVDVRRMHDLGVVTDQELIQSYMDIGYNAEKALKMANFTIKFNASHEKELTRGAILESYEEGLISRGDATELLLSQDYSDELADYYLSLTEFNRGKKVQSLQIDNIRDNYLLAIKTKSQTRTDLNSLGLLQDKIEALLDSWELDKYKYQNIPTKSELDRFYVKGIINETQWSDLMQRHGFSSAHISWFKEELRGELERAGKEPSRTDLATFYKKNVIDEETWRTEMLALGYNEVDTDRYFLSL